ncbi:hypothetical protein BX667DRAFT_140908 [Coemansia mojavensis]|nr:hypothetical protein BX667DRAFT_140908 [Coemansia mojavensis]
MDIVHTSCYKKQYHIVPNKQLKCAGIVYICLSPCILDFLGVHSSVGGLACCWFRPSFSSSLCKRFFGALLVAPAGLVLLAFLAI